MAAVLLIVAVLATGFCLYGGETHHAHAVSHMMTPLCAGILGSSAAVLDVVAPMPTAWFRAERTPVIDGTTLALLEPPPKTSSAPSTVAVL